MSCFLNDSNHLHSIIHIKFWVYGVLRFLHFSVYWTRRRGRWEWYWSKTAFQAVCSDWCVAKGLSGCKELKTYITWLFSNIKSYFSTALPTFEPFVLRLTITYVFWVFISYRERSNVCFIFQESTSSLASSKGGSSSSSSSSSKSISYSWPRRNIELIISFSLSIWNLSSSGVSGITHAMKLVTVNTTNWNTNTKARRAASRCQYCLE